MKMTLHFKGLSLFARGYLVKIKFL